MKRKILSGLFSLALAWVARAQTADFYVNDAVVNCPPDLPPQVDARNFVNNSFFAINFTNFAFLTQLYDTSSTLNFTNYGTMIGNNGFQFDLAPTGTGLRYPARSFYNPGTISAGSLANTNAFFNFFFGLNLPQLLISATNIVDSGTNIVGVDGLFRATGQTLDFNRGVITIEGFENSPTNTPFSFLRENEGIFTAYAAASTNVMVPAAQFENFPPTTPTGLSLPGATFYADVFDMGFGTNLFVQAVFLSDTNAAITNNVYLRGGQTVVEWATAVTNLMSGTVFTNYLYLFDDFGFSGSNLLSAAGMPVNYYFLRTTRPFNFGTPDAPTSPEGWFYSDRVTNEYAAWGAIVTPTTALPGALPGDPITNLPGRIELVAGNSLNLTRAKLGGLNYVRLHATNHFNGSARAQITSPYADLFLGTTNGSLAVTNLLLPTVPRYNGEVDLWSGRWTNSDPVFTVYYHVLFVDSRLSPTAPAKVQDLYLRSTNLVLSDVMNVMRAFLFDGETLTLTTNGPGSQAAQGEINLLNTSITWSGAMPRLKTLTNNGAIRTQNAVFFGGRRNTPFYTTNYDEPYLAMVNRGEIQTQGALIWANYFENTGFLSAGLGSVVLQALDARLRDGSFLATNADIAITSASLIASNHLLRAGRALTFTVTNYLDDGSLANTPAAATNVTTQFGDPTSAILFNSVAAITNKNSWTVGAAADNGLNLLLRPAQASLLGTTILLHSPPGREVVNRWAGEDRGCAPAGFSNNAALGCLILDGGFDSQFTFSLPPGRASCALYVDRLEFRDYTTSTILNGAGNVEQIQLDPGVKIYYAQALATDGSVAERIHGANGGQFCWVWDFAGFYSATNFVYPDGTTNTLNAALLSSQNLDSDSDGLPNNQDLTPILRAQDLAPAVRLLTPDAAQVEISWRTAVDAANYVYHRDALTGGDWQLLTNFVSTGLLPSPGGARVSVTDTVQPASARYYRVRVDAP